LRIPASPISAIWHKAELGLGKDYGFVRQRI